MIVTELYDGQGLGNQLRCYAVTRTIAHDNGFEFGIMCPEVFKGLEFMNLDFGKEVIGGDGPQGGPPTSLPVGVANYYNERKTLHADNADIRILDVDLRKIEDNTKIDGIMQSEEYIKHRKNEIISWFKISEEKKYKSEDLCVIHFRGGDFVGAGSTLLPVEYYSNAMAEVKKVNSSIRFCAVTDDPNLFRRYFPGIEVVGSSEEGVQDNRKASHHIGGPISIDYSIINNAKYLILSNSSFGWWAAWTNTVSKIIIAPKYWARHNISDGFWSTGDSLTEGWIWLDKNNRIFDYSDCFKEKRNE